MNEPIYCLRLDDPATPAFCSLGKLYFGNEHDLLMAVNGMEKAEEYPDTVKGVRSFFRGIRSATHVVAYSTIPVLLPVERVCSSTLSIAAYSWEHTNAWGYSYQMRFRKADVVQLLVKLEQKYYRCIRAWISDLYYADPNDEWRPLDGGFWGHKGLLDISRPSDGSFVLNNLLYVVEDVFDNLADADDYILDPKRLEFGRICDEIFADG